MAAVRLLDHPAQQVAAALASHWDRVADPATPVAELFAAVGVTVPSASLARPAASGRACP